MPTYYDMHCHIGFMQNRMDVLDAVRSLDDGEDEHMRIKALNCTVTPEEYEQACKELASYPFVQTALGLHPWWLVDDAKPVKPNSSNGSSKMLEQFLELSSSVNYIGEVGMDFSAKALKLAPKKKQVECFTKIIDHLSSLKTPPKLISIHATKAASAVLDILEDASSTDKHVCIFHWFAESSQELTRAIKAGCYFSVGFKMLSTKRGKEYAKAIPKDKLLLETDLPFQAGAEFSAEEWIGALEQGVKDLASIRLKDPKQAPQIEELLEENSNKLLRL